MFVYVVLCVSIYEKSFEMLIFLWQFDCPDMTLCGWQDIKSCPDITVPVDWA